MINKYNQKQYYSNNSLMYNKQNEGDRFFFAAPFLFGALAGGAVASVTRPRPVYVTPPSTYYNPAYPHGSTSYNYYYPVR